MPPTATSRVTPELSSTADRARSISDGPADKAAIGTVRGATSAAKDVSTIASGRLALAVLSAGSVVITTRMLGPAGYGTVALVGIIVTLLFNTGTSWTGIAVRRYGREDLDAGRSMSRLTWNRAVIGGPVATAAVTVLVALKLIHALPSFLTWWLILIAIATAVTTIIIDHWSCLLETSGKMKISAGGQVCRQGLYVGVLVALFALVGHASPQTILLLTLSTSVLLVVAVAPFVWRLGIVPVSVDRNLLRRMLVLSIPMIAFMFSEYVLGSIDIVILRIFRGQSEVGVYAVAYQGYSVLSRIAVSITAVFVPLFVSLRAAGKQHLVTRYLARGVPQAMFLLATSGGLLIPLLPLFVPIMFGTRFTDAATPLAILAVSLLALFGGYLLAPILTLHEATKAVAAVNVVAAVVNVIGDILMVGVFHLGIVAPAIATSAALTLELAAYYVIARRLLDEPDARVNPLMLLPIATGLIPTLIWGTLASGIAGVLATIVIAGAVVLWRSPFTVDDVALIDKLELPGFLKQTARILATVGAR